MTTVATALILCECAGLQTIYLEREPITTGHRMGVNGFGAIGLVSGPSSYGDPISKANLLKHWGEPDEIVRRGNREDWVYTQTRWTGFSLILVYRLPVWLPIGDGGATLTFEQDTFVEGWDEVMKARIHIVSLTGLPLIEEMTSGEFWYSGPQSGGGGKSYGGGTSFRSPEFIAEEMARQGIGGRRK